MNKTSIEFQIQIQIQNRVVLIFIVFYFEKYELFI